MAIKRWTTINRVAKGKGMLKGCWLVDPDGEKRATIMDETLARQLAAAMNLTTPAQRVEYSAAAAGYIMNGKYANEVDQALRYGNENRTGFVKHGTVSVKQLPRKAKKAR